MFNDNADSSSRPPVEGSEYQTPAQRALAAARKYCAETGTPPPEIPKIPDAAPWPTPATEPAPTEPTTGSARQPERDTGRKSLVDVLKGKGEVWQLARIFDATDAARDFQPMPSGDYVCHVKSGELFESRVNQTPGYKLTFEVIEGEHSGRRLWNDLWLTDAAMSMTKRDLAKLGVSSLNQLEQPLPRGIRCRVSVVLRSNDNGATFNRVKTFDVEGFDEPEQDAFAPVDGGGNPVKGGQLVGARR